MFKYLELAVELKKSYVAKEGIFQYKLICQQTNIKSFEDVVRRYIELAEEKAEWAKNRAGAKATEYVDDLDVVQTPEEILLSAVSSEDQQDRSERVKLIPWVRFLWEAYRQCLDILKNNVRTEALYHEIAHRAFQFCTKFTRKTEFRKLCDNIRTHTDHLRKFQLNQQPQMLHAHMVNLNNPDSLALHLETRLIQLESAVQIELWQEAYRATDDIKRYGLMNLNKKPPKPQLMANYYSKLALVFWKADCHLFHAAALFRLFHLTRELKKSITPEEVQRMASRLVVATISVPISPSRPEIDKIIEVEENTFETHQRNLASLLGLTTLLPTRTQLVKDLNRMGYLKLAHKPVQDLYETLELNFNPLEVCQRVQECLKSIDESPELSSYTEAIKKIAIIRLLSGVAQVYQTIEYDRLNELCPFADKIQLETMVVEAARRNDLQVRIDHRKNCLNFGTELCYQTEETFEGPHLQAMPSEQVRLQLVNTYSTLVRAQQMIDPSGVQFQMDRLRDNILHRYLIRKDIDHEATLSRSLLIEERKKQLEILSVRFEKEEKLRLEAKQRKLAEQENQRLQAEKEDRERQIKDRETTVMTAPVDDIVDIKTNIEQARKEQKEQVQKQKRLERKIDHLERAKRLEEIPLLEAEYEKWHELNEKYWQESERQRIQDIIDERHLAVSLSERLTKIREDAADFAATVDERHKSIFQTRLQDFNAKLDDERTKRLEARRIRRREERRIQWLKEKEKAEEDRRRQIDEEKRKLREEEDRRREEEDRRRAHEEDERKSWRTPAAEPVIRRGFGEPSARRGFDNPEPIIRRGFGGGPPPSDVMPPRAAANMPPSRDFVRGAPPDGPAPTRGFERGPPPSRGFERGPALIRDFEQGPPPTRDFERGPPPTRDFERGPPPTRDFERGPPPTRDFERGPPPTRDFERGSAPVRDFERGPAPVRDFERGPPPSREFERGPQQPARGGFGGPPRAGPPKRPDPDADSDWRQSKPPAPVAPPRKAPGAGKTAAPEGSWR